MIKNKFVDDIKKGKTSPIACNYHCLRTCNPKTAPYCIAKALTSAAEGDLDKGFVFAGSNAYRCNEIVPVKTLIDELVSEAIQYM